MIRDIIAVNVDMVGADLSRNLNAIGITCKPAHKADLPAKAARIPEEVQYLEISLPVQVCGIFNRVRHYRKLFQKIGCKNGVKVLVSAADSSKVDPTLGNGFRSRVSKLLKEGNSYVSKRYFPHYSRYFSREVDARIKISNPAISEISITGAYEFETIFHDSTYTFGNGFLEYYDVRIARQIMEIVSGINQQGFAIVDWNPDSFIIGNNGLIKIVDFEFCQAIDRSGTDFENSVDYIGGRKFGLECPGRKDCSYKDFWYPVLGVSYKTLMNGSNVEIGFKRLLHWLFIRFPNFVWSQIESQLSHFRKWIWFLRHRDRWVEL